MKGINQKFKGLLFEVIERNFSNPDLSVFDLATKMYMSERQFYRKVKRYTGITPLVLLREYRLKKARDLLETQEFEFIKEVAFEVGFNKPCYFSQLFIKRFNIKPSDYFISHGRNEWKSGRY